MLRTVVLPCAALLLILLLAVIWLPLAAVPALAPGLMIVEGSRPLAGTALMANGTVQLEWRWCPARGPLALCVNAIGGGGRADGVVSPAPGHWRVREITVAQLPLAALGLAPSLVSGRIDATLMDLVARPLGDCLYADFSAARGEGVVRDLNVMGESLTDHRIVMDGADGPTALHLDGDAAVGTLVVESDGRLHGAITLGSGAEARRLPVNQPLPCSPAGQRS